jgi:flavodoxin
MEGIKKMKILVTFDTRFGHTLRVARKIAENFGAQTEEIIDKKDRRRLVSWFLSAFDEELRTPTEIQKVKNNPANFDLVIIGTPIWDGITPAVRRYISKYKFKKVAFFITFGASAEDAAYVMETTVKKKPIAVLELQDREILLGADKKINDFCEEIKKSI